MSTVAELVRKQENYYITGNTTISKYVTFDQYENINKIDAYLNSKHISGDVDSKNREKPFFNIVTAAVNIWFRATDIDRKNIRIKATKKSHYVLAFIATILLQNWMRKTNFGALLNDWGRSLARYGSTVLKFVEKNGELVTTVIPWNRLISDTVDFEGNPKIEILWLTPAQLRMNKAYDQDMVEQLIETRSARETTGRQRKDNKSDYIKLYEVHGNLELSNLTDNDKDKNVYEQQMHVLSFVARKQKGEFEDFTLYRGKEAKDPYMITHLIKEDGRAQSTGAVEHLFEAQWMVNHSIKSIKDQLDLASKLIFQTADGNYVGKNVLTAIETGDILVYDENKPLTQLANSSHDISSLQSFGSQWQVLAKEITSTPDSISGNTMPSGTAYRQVAILNQESHSLFEIMTENKGLAIETMLRERIIPFLKKQMDTTEEISVILDSQGVAQFDSMYVPSEVTRRDNAQIKKTVLSGKIAQNMDKNALTQQVQQEVNQTGNQRFIKPSEIPNKTWKEVLKDLEWEVECEVTGEESDKQAVMTTLTTVMQTIATNPGVLQDPNMKVLFNKILEATGSISPVEIQAAQQQPQGPTYKVAESISFKDLPPNGQVQMAKQAGIDISAQPSVGGSSVAQPVAQGQPMNGNS